MQAPPRRVTVLQRIDKNRLNKALQERKQKYKASKKERNNQSVVSPWEKPKPKLFEGQTCAKHGKPKGTFKPKDKKIFHFAAIEFWRQLICFFSHKSIGNWHWNLRQQRSWRNRCSWDQLGICGNWLWPDNTCMDGMVPRPRPLFCYQYVPILIVWSCKG